MQQLTISRRKLREGHSCSDWAGRGGFRTPARWQVLVNGHPVAEWEAGECWLWIPTELGTELGLDDGWAVYGSALQKARLHRNFAAWRPIWTDFQRTLRDLLTGREREVPAPVS